MVFSICRWVFMVFQQINQPFWGSHLAMESPTWLLTEDSRRLRAQVRRRRAAAQRQQGPRALGFFWGHWWLSGLCGVEWFRNCLGCGYYGLLWIIVDHHLSGSISFVAYPIDWWIITCELLRCLQISVLYSVVAWPMVIPINGWTNYGYEPATSSK